jgi:hypothetical protein
METIQVYTEDEIRQRLRDTLKSYPTQRAFCLAHGIDPGWLTRVLQGRKIGQGIPALLGYTPIHGYRQRT